MGTDPAGGAAAGGRPAVFQEFPLSEIEQPVSARFEGAARRFPDHVAVDAGGRVQTYAELDRAADRVAQHIALACGAGEGRVALIFRDAAAVIPALLGVLKAGKVYVPVDPTYPANRVRHLLDDSDTGLVLTDGATAALTREAVGETCPVLDLDAAPAAAGEKRLELATSPGDIATLLYTSGSTGVPKGVMQSHRNLLQHVRNYTNQLAIRSDDRISLLFSYSFSASLLDIFGALCNGATLCPFDVRSHEADALARWVASARITHLHLVPSLYRRFVGALSGDEDLSALRRVDMAGEPITDADVATHRRLLPRDCTLHYRFAASEASFITAHAIGPDTPVDEGGVPVGRPGDGMEVLILGADGAPVEAGALGEIVLRSAYLCPGYWRRPDLTDAAFADDPDDPALRRYRTGDLGRLRPDGALVHLGRGDNQVKIRGFTVDLSEVEAGLRRLEGVRDAVVVARNEGRANADLAAFVVPEEGVSLARAAIRIDLLEELPRYMVPAVVVPTPALPLTPTGKVDQRALAELASDATARRGPPVAPRDELETALADMWRAALKLPEVGIHDDFFELGGDSLAAVAIVTRIESELGPSVPTTLLHVAPTIEELASQLRTIESVQSESLAHPFRVHGSAPPLFAVPGRGGDPIVFSYLAKNLAADRPFYGLSTPGIAPEHENPRSFEELAALQLAAIREIQPTGPYHVMGYSSGALVAFELARQILAAGETVGFLGSLDGFAPGYPKPVGGHRWYQRLADRLGPGKSVLLVRQTSLRRLVSEIRRDLRRELTCRAKELLGRPLSRAQRYRRLKRRHTRHRNSYRPAPAPLRMTLFRAADPGIPDHYTRDPHYGWHEYALGGVEIHDFPGEHNDLVYDPVANLVAERLDACLKQ